MTKKIFIYDLLKNGRCVRTITEDNVNYKHWFDDLELATDNTITVSNLRYVLNKELELEELQRSLYVREAFYSGYDNKEDNQC